MTSELCGSCPTGKSDPERNIRDLFWPWEGCKELGMAQGQARP